MYEFGTTVVNDLASFLGCVVHYGGSQFAHRVNLCLPPTHSTSVYKVFSLPHQNYGGLTFSDFFRTYVCGPRNHHA
jgi:hypothetical protein